MLWQLWNKEIFVHNYQHHQIFYHQKCSSTYILGNADHLNLGAIENVTILLFVEKRLEWMIQLAVTWLSSTLR